MEKGQKFKVYFIGFIVYTIGLLSAVAFLGILPPSVVVPLWIILGAVLIFFSEYLGIAEEFFG